MLFNQTEREAIRKYSGKWGFQMPYGIDALLMRYNLLKIQKEIIRLLRIKQILYWIEKMVK